MGFNSVFKGLKEIKDGIKMLNQKKAPCLDLITAGMLNELSKGLVNLKYLFRRHTTTRILA